jgi:hypothetical protein
VPVSRAPKNAKKSKSLAKSPAKKSTKPSPAKKSNKKDVKKSVKKQGPRLFPTKAELEAMKLAREAKSQPSAKTPEKNRPTTFSN